MTDHDDDAASARPRRVTYLLPTLFTVLNLFLGFLAIVKAFRDESGDVGEAALLVLLSGVADKLDGLMARVTGTASDFGAELDSLADVVSFGMAPALVAFAWGLQSLGKPGLVGAFLFLACGSLRLARFNVQSGDADRRWFVGLPIPMAAAVLMSVIYGHAWMHPENQHLTNPRWGWLFLALTVSCAFLMVSNLRYYAFKEISVGREHRLLVVLGFSALLVVIFAWPFVVLPAIAGAYALSGPAERLVRWRPGAAAPGVPE